MPIPPLRTSPRLNRSVLDVVQEVQPGRRLSLGSPSPVRTTTKVEPRTPQRDFIASTINFFRGANGRVNAEGWEQVMEELEKSKIKMSLSDVKKIGGAYMKQMKAGVPMPEISLSRKRKGGYTSLTPLIARKMMEIQATHHGKLSSRRLCGKMKLENLDFSERSVFNWCNALGIKKYKRYIKPKLKPHQG